MTNENALEIWECTTGGTVWVQVKDPRVPGGWRQQKVGGKGKRSLRITVEEREFNHEIVPEDNAHHDPFRNGLLRQIGGDNMLERNPQQRTDDELVTLIKDSGDDEFIAAASELNELTARRLLALSEKHATMVRLQAIQALVDDSFKVGKTSRVVKEIWADDARYAGADM